MKYFTFHYFLYIIFSQVFLYLLIVSFTLLFLKRFKIFKIFSLILIFVIILSDIIFYFSTDLGSLKIFNLFSISICIDFLLIINFLNIVYSQKENKPDIESEKIGNIYIDNICVRKRFFILLLVLLFLNIITFSLIFLFKYFSFSINFFVIITIAFLLFILLFRFFENVKKVKEKKEQKIDF